MSPSICVWTTSAGSFIHIYGNRRVRSGQTSTTSDHQKIAGQKREKLVSPGQKFCKWNSLRETVLSNSYRFQYARVTELSDDFGSVEIMRTSTVVRFDAPDELRSSRNDFLQQVLE